MGYFGLFDTGKAMMGEKPNVLMLFALGQVVTVSAGIISYPLDTVRRRLMMTSGQGEKLYNVPWIASLRSTRKKVLKPSSRDASLTSSEEQEVLSYLLSTIRF